MSPTRESASRSGVLPSAWVAYTFAYQADFWVASKVAIFRYFDATTLRPEVEVVPHEPPIPGEQRPTPRRSCREP